MPNTTLSIDVSRNKIRLYFNDPTGDVCGYLSQRFANCNNCLDTCDQRATPTYTCHPWGRVWSKNRLEFWLPNPSPIITDEFISTAIQHIIAPLQLPTATENVPVHSISTLRSRSYVTVFPKTNITPEQLLSCICVFLDWTEIIRQENPDHQPDSAIFLTTGTISPSQMGLGIFTPEAQSVQQSPLPTSRAQL